MRVAVTGATGMLGGALVRALVERGDEVTALSRNAARASEALGVPAETWADPEAERPPLDALRGRDGVVHLLGEVIAQRWSKDARREIRDSRVLSTRNLVAALAELTEEERPKVLISGSGAGWYGHRGDERLDESTPEPGDDFLAQLSADWEAEARRAEELGIRVVLNRTGVVLSDSGGALEKMLPFFKAGIGGPVAGGRQYVPWVHVDDVVGATLFSLETAAMSGPVNVTAPEPVTNKELSRTLGRVLRRPAFAPVPALAVKALYGEMAEIVTTGQRAMPGRLTELGYEFRRPELEAALREIVG
ncbi:MAG TPA: TIGR01777 family oxidoreductase [Thermoleophilaceae bacterium]|nr:TIGR01777 family oxidoreductase [Thermoleophilaceae bacterium]